MTKEEAWNHIFEVHYGISFNKEDMTVGEIKRKNPIDDTKDTSTKPSSRKKKISKFAKVQQPQDDRKDDLAGRKVLKQLSNTKMKLTAAVWGSKGLERVSD